MPVAGPPADHLDGRLELPDLFLGALRVVARPGLHAADNNGPGAWARLHRPRRSKPVRLPHTSRAGDGVNNTTLITQVMRLQRELGQRLLDRAPGQAAMRLTAFGW